jgi:hypothetical protein
VSSVIREEGREETVEPLLTVRRGQGGVMVTVRGELNQPGRQRLGQVLDDLIIGQGNLFLTVELPDTKRVGIDTLEVLVGAAEGAWARQGRLTVRTPRGDLTELGRA